MEKARFFVNFGTKGNKGNAISEYQNGLNTGIKTIVLTQAIVVDVVPVVVKRPQWIERQAWNTTT